MKWLFLIWLVLISVTAHAQSTPTPTATPTPVGPAMCSVTGTVVNADGSPFVNGTITFNSQRIQVINGYPVNPTVVTTNTDYLGNIVAKSLPQGLAMQITICPGQQQTANCSAPFSAIIPFSQTANFGQLAQGTQLTGSSALSLTTLSVTGQTTTGSLFINGQNQFQSGSFTPTLQCTGGNPTISTGSPVGNWWTSGNTLFYYLQMFWNSSTGGSGGAIVGGLPFPAVGGGSGQGGFIQQVIDTNSTSSSPGSENRLEGTIYNGQAYVTLYEGATFGGDFLFPLPCANAYANTPSGIFITGWYKYQ